MASGETIAKIARKSMAIPIAAGVPPLPADSLASSLNGVLVRFTIEKLSDLLSGVVTGSSYQ
jgi:hypothetical protein